jgi:hypothetical protein
MNPLPQEPYKFFNIWKQGELGHPGIGRLAQALFDAAGYRDDLASLGRNDHRTLLFCNFRVRSPKFRNEFTGFLVPLFDCITKHMPKGKSSNYYNPTFHHGPERAPLFPFIFERMLSTFPLLNPHVAARHYPHTREEMRAACMDTAEWMVADSLGDIIDECGKRIFPRSMRLYDSANAWHTQLTEALTELNRVTDPAGDRHLSGRLKGATTPGLRSGKHIFGRSFQVFMDEGLAALLNRASRILVSRLSRRPRTP